MDKFIYAPATPLLRSAISIVRLSGDGVFDALRKCFSPSFKEVTKRTALVGTIKDGDRLIDQVVLLLYKGPNSYDGEDMGEIMCHGSPLIVEEICTLLETLGGRKAAPGEFSARAYYNGKMDLVQAEAVNDLISADTEGARTLALSSLQGLSSGRVKPLRDEVEAMLALMEVGFDYPEYDDIATANLEEIGNKAKKVAEVLESLIKEGREGRLVKDGVKVALIGKPNVGKSSLLNALLHKDKAIVSDIPGTTRDVVEGDLNYKGLSYHFLDTAGLREGEGAIEKIGIEKSLEAAEEADILVLVLDSLNEERPEIDESLRGKEMIEVYNKADLLKEEKEGRLYVSALKQDVEPLLKEISKRLGLSEKAFRTPSLNNARQLSLLSKARGALLEASSLALGGGTADIVSSLLLEGYNNLRELLGEGVTSDLTDEIFSRFCVGK